MIVISVTIFLFIAYVFLILYFRQSWLQIAAITKNSIPNTNQPATTITVIIPARNEEANIRQCLSSIMLQSYPKNLFEVIVVDDFSTDDTANTVTLFSDKNVSLISLADFIGPGILNSYKKKAIEIAISKATGDLIVTTDADCIAPSTWLHAIASFYEKFKPVFIAAPVAYYRENNFLKIFQSLDFMTLQGVTGAAVYKKFLNMCNGANLAYEKKVFYEVGGFKNIETIASGDDMLLMQKIYRQYPERVLFLKSENAIVQTLPMKTLHLFINQRIRWASKSDKYADKKIIGVLLLVYLFNVWILLLAILCFFYHSLLFWFAGVLIAKTIIELFFIYPVSVFFKKEKLLWWFPLAQPFHILYTIMAGWLGKFGSYQWKERNVK